jgi:alpha-tubulin suppressor-like RCC1 family protein
VLGTGNTTSSYVPVAVTGLTETITEIAAGSRYSLALTAGGTVPAWGYNGTGQLGDGTTEGPEKCPTTRPCSTTPVAVSGLKEVVALAAGDEHSLALLKNGEVMAWGANEHGQLGTAPRRTATCQ